MKVRFLKDYKHTVKFFRKGSIVYLDRKLANVLLKKKVVEPSDEVTKEEVEISKHLNKD